MQKSETLGKISEALAKLQGEIQNVHKDRQGYGYKYADLSSVLDISRPLCSKYGISIVQLCCNPAGESGEDPDVIGVNTMLVHSSGEYIGSELFMRVTANKGMSAAQAAGSVITYARRYALAAILGISQTDDDAFIKVEPKEESLYNTVSAQCRRKKITVEEARSWCERFGVRKLCDATEVQLNEILTLLACR